MSPSLRRVLSHIPSGKDNDRIARDVGLSPTTLNAYITKIYAHLQIPDSIVSRKQRRNIAGATWEAFAKLYVIDDEGHIVARPSIVERPSLAQSHAAPVPICAPVQEPVKPQVPHTNGVTHPAAEVLKPEESAKAPELTAQGYGVGITVTVPEPQTVSDVRILTLGTDTSAEELQKLIRAGYMPEIVNDYQSLSGSRSVTKLILVKRKP